MSNLGALKKDLEIVINELKSCTDSAKNIVEKMKTIIGNDIAACKRDGCTVENPCTVCKTLYKLDEEIDDFLDE